MFEPRPEISTATRTFSAMMACAPVAGARPRSRPSRRRCSLSRRPRRGRSGRRFLLLSQASPIPLSHPTSETMSDHADAAIEGAGDFLRLDIALRLEERHQPRLRPAIGIDRRVQPLGQHARNVLQQAAAGDVRQRRDPAGPDRRQQRLRRRSGSAPAAPRSAAGRDRTRRAGRASSPCRRRAGAPAKSRSNGPPTRPGRACTSPAFTLSPVSASPRSTAPTQKPARS